MKKKKKVAQMIKKTEKILWKKYKNSWLPAFSTFLTMFSKTLIHKAYYSISS